MGYSPVVAVRRVVDLAAYSAVRIGLAEDFSALRKVVLHIRADIHVEADIMVVCRQAAAAAAGARELVVAWVV